MIAAFQAQSVKFITLFLQDNRTDPNCVFIFVSLVPGLYGGKAMHVAVLRDTPNLNKSNQNQSQKSRKIRKIAKSE